MALEVTIERESCKLLQRLLGDAEATPKFGEDGWPDRQVLLGNGRHFWLEFKQLKGRARAAQLERVKQLEKRGDLVYWPRSVDDAVEAFYEALRRLR